MNMMKMLNYQFIITPQSLYLIFWTS